MDEDAVSRGYMDSSGSSEIEEIESRLSENIPFTLDKMANPCWEILPEVPNNSIPLEDGWLHPDVWLKGNTSVETSPLHPLLIGREGSIL